MRRAPEIDFKNAPRVIVRRSLDFAQDRVPSVIEYDVEPAESVLSSGERGGDVRRLSDVAFERDDTLGSVRGDEIVDI